MRPEISEFSYGYTVTDNLIHSEGFPLSTAPVFPSLFAEGQTGGGWDVRLDSPVMPLFLQFKLSHKMVRNTAKESQLGLFDVPFYRMHLRSQRLSSQHQLLLDLENQGNCVSYVAPFFSNENELNDAYLNHEVLSKSIWVSPSAIGSLPDNSDHWIAFADTSTGYFCSEPKKMGEPISFDAFKEKILQAVRKESAPIDIQALAELNDSLMNLVRASVERAKSTETQLDLFDPVESRIWDREKSDAQTESIAKRLDQIDEKLELRDDDDVESVIKRTAYVAKTFFGCEMLITKISE